MPIKKYKPYTPSRRGMSVIDYSATLTGELESRLRDGDTVLVKGSLGSRMQVVVDALRSLGHGVTTNAEEEV